MPRQGVFLKLLGIFLVTGVAVNVIVGVAFRGALFNDPARIMGQRHVGRYLNYLIDDFGHPPHPDRIKKFTQDLDIDVRIEDRSKRPVYGDELPSIDVLEPHVMRRGPWLRPVGNYSGVFFLIYKTPELNYVFFMPKDLAVGISQAGLIALIAAVSLVVGIEYLVLRRLVTKELKQRVAESVAAKEQLLRDVSHELRSPQTRMRVALELLPEGHARRAIADDLNEMERMTELILESARFSNGAEQRPKVEIDLTELTKETCATFRDAAPGIDLARLPSGLKTKGDPEWMRIAIRNVLDNALKYSRDSGKKVEVRGAKKDAEVHLWIEDHGPGIPGEELARVFEPFHRVDRSRQKATGGFGLGLHLTKKAQEAQGAKIELTSEPQQGTTASLRFRAI